MAQIGPSEDFQGGDTVHGSRTVHVVEALGEVNINLRWSTNNWPNMTHPKGARRSQDSGSDLNPIFEQPQYLLGKHQETH